MSEGSDNGGIWMDRLSYTHGYHGDQLQVDLDSKNCQEDPSVSFHHLMEGIRKLEDERVDFFAKLATVIPRLGETAQTGYDNIEIPESPRFWMRVLQHLVQQNEWLGVWCLLHPDPGDQEGEPSSPLHGRARDLTTNEIKVSGLLNSLNDLELTTWGIQLAICLLRKGAAVESIAADDTEPLTITAVRSALKTGNTDLLDYLLGKRPSLILHIDESDLHGDSPLHLCVKMESQNNVLKALLDLGCCTSVQDSQHQPAIHYLKVEDPRHQLLEQAAKHAGDGLKKRIDKMKTLGDEHFQQDEYTESLRWYKHAMDLAESVTNLKLELALLHSSCSCVYANLAVLEDQGSCSIVPSLNIEVLYDRKNDLTTLLSGMRCPRDHSNTHTGDESMSDLKDENDVPQAPNSTELPIKDSQLATKPETLDLHDNCTMTEKSTNSLKNDQKITTQDEISDTPVRTDAEVDVETKVDPSVADYSGDREPNSSQSEPENDSNNDFHDGTNEYLQHHLDCDDFESTDEETLTDSSDCDTVVDNTEDDARLTETRGSHTADSSCHKEVSPESKEFDKADNEPSPLKSELGSDDDAKQSAHGQAQVDWEESETTEFQGQIAERLDKSLQLEAVPSQVEYPAADIIESELSELKSAAVTEVSSSSLGDLISSMSHEIVDGSLEEISEKLTDISQEGAKEDQVLSTGFEETLDKQHARKREEHDTSTQENTRGVKSDDASELDVKLLEDTELQKLSESNLCSFGETDLLEEVPNETLEPSNSEVPDLSPRKELSPQIPEVTKHMEEVVPHSKEDKTVQDKALNTGTVRPLCNMDKHSEKGSEELSNSGSKDDQQLTAFVQDSKENVSECLASENGVKESREDSVTMKGKSDEITKEETQTNKKVKKFAGELTINADTNICGESTPIQNNGARNTVQVQHSTENDTQNSSSVEKSIVQKHWKRRNKKVKRHRKTSKPLPIDEKYLEVDTKEETNEGEKSTEIEMPQTPQPKPINNEKSREPEHDKDGAKLKIKHQTVAECKSSILEVITDTGCLIFRDFAKGNDITVDGQSTENEVMPNLIDIKDIGDDEDIEFEPGTFDNTTWEVECTAKAWKSLQEHYVPQKLKQKVIKMIENLAHGSWNCVERDTVKDAPKGVFETRLYENASLIWEKAVAFSGRCSDAPEKRIDDDDSSDFAVEGGRIYTEIIRIWGIVFSDAELEELSETIQRSHMRGQSCLLKKNLQSLKCSKHENSTNKYIPRQFCEHRINRDGKMLLFYPPASPNKTEYHILKFYTFTSALVNIVLGNIARKVDLPFKVTDREDAIIRLHAEAPILLLGRSGTGKTTCCLYRLWTSFISYWETSQGTPFMLRTEWFFGHASDDQETENEEDNASGSEEKDCDDVSECLNDDCDEEEEDADYEDYDHLHQIFVTKNPVLCTEVKKNFYELCRAHEETMGHAEAATDDIPPKLQDVEDLLYPLFLTSKQLLLMLDASLEPPHFFERNEDGSLSVIVHGWEDKNNAGILLLDQDYVDEGDDGWDYYDLDQEEDDDPEEAPRTVRQQKLDPRKEVTYQVFAEVIWPKILKRMSVKYHPSLVWTEIMSFIKGSYEALSKPKGHLSETEYLDVGRKRAPNFSGERDKIYELFKRYEHFKSQHLMFDEADLVQHIFRRLKNVEDLPWILHQLYVDETQDFTQAELSVLLRITQHPNDMFLTGDTAQGIMRGISFRFCDLRSLFYHAKNSLKEHQKRFLNEPRQVYQLTHSYRSHAGILSLASAVLDLMVEFFPESFDRLKKDQGLFDGPAPILLESCSIEDLLILLQGNNRETSHIEFGAHQAILVVNQAAKETMPEILSKHSIVLTIYESKGLEFDDVLLYNFFTDSEATKEWRVVTTFLESLSSRPQEEEDIENLHTIDEEMLRQPNRPRPLTFDPNQHKVLNSELKYLYTALTRARVNVWLFDEDEEKRAPMFEYFKARKLVRCISESEQGTTDFDDMVFAMKSSPEDWVRRGDEMMAQSLYDIAAKCYGMGWDKNKENLALAHSQAQKANRMKDTPKRMKDEFVLAASKFLECGELLKATQCLQNAQEYELAARSYKRMNKLSEAARMFQRAKNPTAASDCYEQLDQYNKAVQLLDKEELYEEAVQCLQRYYKRVQSLTEEERPIPKVLEDYKPQFTEKGLYLKLADLCHNQNMQKDKPKISAKILAKMLTALKHLSREEELEYLENHGYLEEAAEVMLKGGSSSHSEVAEMMLRHDKNEEALQHAQKGNDKEILGRSHHAFALKKYANMDVEGSKNVKTNIDSDPLKTEIIHHFQKAKEYFKKSGNSNSAGVSCYYIAVMTKSIRDAKEAYTFFKNVKPFSNEAGMVEAWKIVVKSIKKVYFFDCKSLISVVDTLLNVMYILLSPSKPEQRNRFKLYMQFYGLHENDKDPNTLLVYPNQRPRCAEKNVIPNFYSKKEKKETCMTRNKDEMSTKVCLYLAGILEKWTRTCRDWLLNQLNRSLQCRAFKEGRETEQGSSCGDSNCLHIHEPYSKLSALKVLEILFSLINLDATVHQGIKLLNSIPLRRQSRGELDKKLETVLQGRKFQSCMELFGFLIPESHYTESKELMNNPAFKKVKDHVRDYLDQSLKETLENKCAGLDWIVRTATFAPLFGLNIDLKKVCYAIESEVYQRKDLLASERNLAFIVYRNYNGDDIIELLGKIFWDSCLSLQCDLVKAVFTYTRYVKILGDRNKPSLFPKMPLFFAWHELFVTVEFLTLLKLSPSGCCILPYTYLNTLSWMNSISPKEGKTVQQLINETYRSENSIKDLKQRMVHFAGVLCGYKKGISLLRYLFQSRKQEESFPFLIAERCLILALVFLSNVGLLVPLELETPLMKSILDLELPENAPKRLVQTLKDLQEAQGVADILSVLTNLLQQREQEFLYLCTWQWDTKRQEGIQREQIKDLDKFSSKFFGDLKDAPQDEDAENEETDEVVEEEERPPEEEIQKHLEEQHKYEQEEAEENSARIIQRFFKRITFTGRIEIGNLKQRCRKQELTEMFAAYQITKEWCGICWVSLTPQQAEVPENDFTETDVPPDQHSTEEPGKEDVDELSFKSIVNTWLEQEKESQTLYDAHLVTHSHQQNVSYFQQFKDLHEEYFMFQVPEIQEFMEGLRNQQIFISQAFIHLPRFDYMMNVVYEIQNRIFMENHWRLVHDLRSKLIPLCLYYKGAVEEMNMMNNQYMIQQQQQAQQQEQQIVDQQEQKQQSQHQEEVFSGVTSEDDLQGDIVEEEFEDGNVDEMVNVEYVPSNKQNVGNSAEGGDARGERMEGNHRHANNRRDGWRGQNREYHRGYRGGRGGNRRWNGGFRGGQRNYVGGHGDYRDDNRGLRRDNRNFRGGHGDNGGFRGPMEFRRGHGAGNGGFRHGQQNRPPNLAPRHLRQMAQEFEQRRYQRH